MNNEKLKMEIFKQSCTNVGVGLASTLSQMWGIDPTHAPAYRTYYKVSEG